MVAEYVSSADDGRRALEELAGLRQFGGPPAEFWNSFLAAAGALAGATQAVLILQNPPPGTGWKRLTHWSANGQTDRLAGAFSQQLDSLAERCLAEGSLAQPLEAQPGAKGPAAAVAVRLQLHRANEVCIAAFLVPDPTGNRAREALVRLRLVADTPASYQMHQVATQAQADVEKFANTLDLMVQLNAERRFLAAALTFCNGLATRFRADRASLGWFEQGYVHLKAISRTERFDPAMAAVKSLEIAMEESLDQDEEIVWPAPAGSTVVTRDHEAYGRQQGVRYLCSVPLRLDDQTVAVLLCERQDTAFTELELRQLRLISDQAVRRLADLHDSDRWFGKRWAAAARRRLGEWVGVERTWTKVVAVLVSLLLLALIIVRVNYRVEANFIVRSDSLAYLTAPFDGYIDQVDVRLGDPVKQGEVLLSLAKNDLELSEAADLADVTRYQREAEKARATNALADMRIALAMVDEARAKLDADRYHLQQSSVRAPFAGVVVEGDQKERIGAPVKQGDVLFKVAKTESLYAEADVSEKDIQNVATNVAGQVAFASQPKLKYPIRIELIEAAAQPKEEGNVFPVRCRFTGPTQPWWRPGMTGVCKIDAGRRTLFWVLTHRTVDYFRLLLWW
jgi:multidrug resistance efflux pump/GAF domain-containing protein